MTPETLKEILTRIKKPAYYTELCEDYDPEAPKKNPYALYDTAVDQLYSGIEVTICDESNDLSERKRAIAKEMASRLFADLAYTLVSDDDDFRDEWVYDLDPRPDLDAASLALASAIESDLAFASPIKARFTLTEELLAVIRERMERP